MVIIVVQSVPTRLRGELTRWMLELRAGVFVGHLSAMVRDKLWERVCSQAGAGGAVLAHNTNSEQGFALRFWGATDRTIEDFDGLYLVRMPQETLQPAVDE